MKTAIAWLTLLTCYVYPLHAVVVTLSPLPQTIPLGQNVRLSSLTIKTSNEVIQVKSLSWHVHYYPTARFETVVDTNAFDVGYCYCGRMQDYSLFTNWKLRINASNVFAQSFIIPPVPHGGLVATVVITNINYLIPSNTSVSLELFADLSPELSSGATRGFITDDEVGVYFSKTRANLQDLDGNTVSNIVVANDQPLTNSVVQRPLYSSIASIRKIGDHVLVTVSAEKGKKYLLQTSHALNDWYFGGGEAVIESKYGEIHFLYSLYTWNNVPAFLRIRSVDESELRYLVQMDIILPNESDSSPGLYRPGKLEIKAKIETDPIIRPQATWLSDTGETGQGDTFTPTFEAGIHWVKLRVRGAATEADAFKWVIVLP